jgi:type I restriction enzyme, S subunit
MLSDIIDHRGKTPTKLGGDWVQDGIIALSAKHVKNGRLIDLGKANRVSLEMYDKWMTEKLREGDILMTSEAPLGEFYYMSENAEYCLSQRLFAMRANREKVLPSYLYYELSIGHGLSQIIGKQSGSTVFGIRQDELRKISVLLPSMNTQVKYDKVVSPILKDKASLEEESLELARLRDFLLPLIMNGQVKVG